MKLRTAGLLGFGLLSGACGLPDASAPIDDTGADSDTVATELRVNKSIRITQTDLVSDRPGAATLDPNLINPWGVAYNPAGPVWVSNNGTDTSTVYDGAGALKLTVTFPQVDGADVASKPTGQIFNASATAFGGDKFIFSSEDGRFYGWKPGPGVQLRADFSGLGHIYKGLAIGTLANGKSRLFATDFHNSGVTVLDENYAVVPLPAGAFFDYTLPAGYAPFNIQSLEGKLFVTYAKQDAQAEDDARGAGRGYVNVYDFNGKLERRLLGRGSLNSPWGLAIAPPTFGPLAGKLLVGNFGDGAINAYDIHVKDSYGNERVESLGALADGSGKALKIEGLWAIALSPDTFFYFTAATLEENHGLYGRLDATISTGTGGY